MANPVGIAISSVEENRERALRLAKTLQSYGAEVVLVLQGSADHMEDSIGGLRILFRRDRGLSKSRNLGLSNLGSEYVWFLDDDVEVSKKMYAQTIAEIESMRPDVMIGRIGCTDCDGYYKNYNRQRVPRRLRLLRVSSIEIIVRRNFIVRNRIVFDAHLGLGSSLPSGEENCFLLDCEENNAVICYTKLSIVAHPCDESNRAISEDWARAGIPYSKGIIARRVGGLIGLLTLSWWVLRALADGVPLQIARGALSGYRSGKPESFNLANSQNLD